MIPNDIVIGWLAECYHTEDGNAPWLDASRFAELAAAYEREQCAKVCQKIAQKQGTLGRQLATIDCENAIRARGEE